MCVCVSVSCVRLCTWVSASYAKRESEGENESKRANPIDIHLASALGTVRLSADEIQINCKAAR